MRKDLQTIIIQNIRVACAYPVTQTNCAFKSAWAREISNTVLLKETIMWVEEITYSKA